MSLKINDKYLCIPPYLSTAWSQISALHLSGDHLVVLLINGSEIRIPDLTDETLQKIYTYHALSLENGHDLPKKIFKDFLGEPALKMSFGSLGGLNTNMQHDPSQTNAPDLPPEVLQKISSITKMLFNGDEISVTPPVPSCNCFHCQIARAIGNKEIVEVAEEPDTVSEEDLKFSEWTITQTGDQLFSVAHCLDEKEKYNVFLGDPIGCTCGKTGCEHILAVLKS